MKNYHVICNSNNMKGEDHIFFSKDKEDTFAEIYYSVMIELLSKQWFVKTFLNIVKAV